ncbi:GNAT family N-acetyltransferase [Solibacillus sp. R5-41]|uniref:GNAT family N-acetyltransferase n=1 Tax=Solibacillus sp. R5-41 TaxID=2048654 RepID=UPI000C1289F8|nr:N-acetyltransferase [Solibacillus sp. R5-41]ATP42141.1 GNAT family N-acetyltransferase [Solibacillus sp. R5-41]
MEISIRQERPEDYSKTEEVVKSAFLDEEYSDKKEHELVHRIRKTEAFIPELSLVALNQNESIVGHILLSKIKIVDGEKAVESLALAPVSVLPEYQKKGIGSQLIKEVLKKAEEAGFHSVIVLGHSEYYPKFGFKQAKLWDIKAPFDVPDEVFMAIELTEKCLESVRGIVQYSEAFSE